MKIRGIAASLLSLAFLLGAAGTSSAEFRIIIMQAQAGEAAKYKPLLDYLEKKGIPAGLVTTKDYTAAANMFAEGKADAMFSGSGVAGTLIIKGLAYPSVRPVTLEGTSTYWAVVIGKKGTGPFSGSADYFKGKKVIFTALASSGEFFYRALPGSKDSTAFKAANHGAAIDAVSKGQADFAIVKNRVWDASKGKYPDLEKIGEDKGENPDNALMIAKKADKAVADKVVAALLAIKDDASPEAKAARETLKVNEFIKTTEKDFSHTLPLLKKAGVDASFNFAF